MAGKALVCTADEPIRAAVAAAGYIVTVAADDETAVPQLRHGKWDLVVLDRVPARETFAYLHALAGKRRRDVFVLTVDERGPTGDRFRAWHESADLIVAPADLERLGALVAEAVDEKDEFYRVFREVQRATGARLGAHA